MSPFSDNLIFFDTEFSSLDPYQGEILSIGMVKASGEELYLELEHDGEVSDWVRENNLPTLTAEKIPRKKAAELILSFVGDTRPFLISYVNQYDAIYLYKLLDVNNNVDQGNRSLPFQWVILDFASVLFALGRSPMLLSLSTEEQQEFYKNLGINRANYRTHYALDDAKFLRDVYLRLFEKKSQ